MINKKGVLIFGQILFLLIFAISPLSALAQSSNCAIKLYWLIGGQTYDATQPLPSGLQTPKKGTLYGATAEFTNCNQKPGSKGYLRISTPAANDDKPVNLDRTPRTYTRDISFSEVGTYSFSAWALDANDNPIADGDASLTVSVSNTSGPNQTPTPTPSGGPTTAPSVTPSVSGVPGGVVATIQNPIPFNSLGELIVAAIRFILTMLGAVTVFFIVWGSVKMVISQGNESAIKTAKATIQWAVIGLIVALTSFSVIALVQSFLRRQ